MTFEREIVGVCFLEVKIIEVSRFLSGFGED